MKVNGNYKRFWGSNEWDIKVDFEYEKAKPIIFTKLTVEFKNSKTALCNTFEVEDLRSCVSLMKKFAVSNGISVFDQRIANWLAEYITDYSVEVDSKEILEYFKSESEEKIDLTVKKLSMVSDVFTDILDYNGKDFQIDFGPFYSDENWIMGSKSNFNYPINTSISYGVKKRKKIDLTEKELKNRYNGIVEVTNSLFNEKDSIKNILIEDTIELEFKPNSVFASLVAPDKTVLGVFKPLEIVKTDEAGLKIIWKIDELKLNHQIKINYILKQRMPFIINMKEEEDTKSYIKYFETNTDENNRFSIKIPAMTEINIFSRSKVEGITALLPIEFTTQEILYMYPHFILKIVDQGNFQKIIFSEIFIDTIFFEQAQIAGSCLPVMTVYESVIPKTGSKISKKVVRHHSFSKPILNYLLESSSNEIIEILEQYPRTTHIQLKSFGSQSATENITESEEFKTVKFTLTATNDSFTYYLDGNPVKELEKALKSIRILNNDIEIEISQNINIETIVDKSNKFFNEFMKSYRENFEGEKIRLRSFNLKIFEKNKVLESTTSTDELDSAFEALQNTNSLESLKAKIASSYAEKFISEPDNIQTTTPEIQTEEEKISNSDEKVEDSILDIEKNYKQISDDVETSEMTDDEVEELDKFLHDYDDSTTSLSRTDTIASTKKSKKSRTSKKVGTEIKETELETESIPSQTQFETDLNVKTEELLETQTRENLEPTGTEVKTSKARKSKVKTKKKTVESISIDFFILNENVKDQTSSEITTESERYLYIVGQNQKRTEIDNIDIVPEKVYFKIPEGERFIILMMNPKEELTSHIYGRWKKQQNPKYKLLLSVWSGSYRMKLQLLNSGKTFDLKFNII